MALCDIFLCVIFHFWYSLSHFEEYIEECYEAVYLL